MEEHDCIQEKEIGKITAILEKVSKEVYGNGDEGLVRTIPRLEEKINNLVGSVVSHTNVISNFIEFQASHDGEVKGRKDLEARLLIARELEATQKRDKTQKRFIVIMAIIGTVGLCFTAYFGFVNSKKSDTAVQNTEITNEKLDIMDNSGLSRAYQEIKQEKGVLKLDSIKPKKTE